MTDTAPYGVIDYQGYAAVVIFRDGLPHIVAESPEAWRIACALNLSQC